MRGAPASATESEAASAGPYSSSELENVNEATVRSAFSQRVIASLRTKSLPGVR